MSRPATPTRRRRDPWLSGADMDGVREFLSHHCDGAGRPEDEDATPCVVFFRPDPATDRVLATLALPAEAMRRSVFSFGPRQRWDLARRRHLVLSALLWYRRELLLPRAALDGQQRDSGLSRARREFGNWKKTLGGALDQLAKFGAWDPRLFDTWTDEQLEERIRTEGDLRALVELKRREFGAIHQLPRRAGRPRKDARMLEWLEMLYCAGGLSRVDAERDAGEVRRQFPALFEPGARPMKGKNPP
jgi:hypothetical protein